MWQIDTPRFALKWALIYIPSFGMCLCQCTKRENIHTEVISFSSTASFSAPHGNVAFIFLSMNWHTVPLCHKITPSSHRIVQVILHVWHVLKTRLACEIYYCTVFSAFLSFLLPMRVYLHQPSRFLDYLLKNASHVWWKCLLYIVYKYKQIDWDAEIHVNAYAVVKAG